MRAAPLSDWLSWCNPTGRHNQAPGLGDQLVSVLISGGEVWQSGRSKHRLRPLRDVLRDRNDLKALTGCADFIPNSLAHQKPCHWVS